MSRHMLTVVPRARKLALILVLAGAFGVMMSAVKGQGAGARLAFGNISAPWLLVAFLAGTRYVRLDRAAAIGVLATLAALFGFYAQQSPIMDLGARSIEFVANPAQVYDFIVGPHQVYFVGGVLSGGLFGILGGWWAKRRSPLAGGVMALMFIAEPFAWIAARGSASAGLSRYVWLWFAEVGFGAAGAGVIAYLRRSAISERQR